MSWQNKAILSTDRCYLRRITRDDAPALYELNADPVVMEYTGESPFTSLAQAEAFAIEYSESLSSQYKKYNLGRWAVIRKEDDVFLGWSGLKLHSKSGFIDIGYRIIRKYWGNGYATEATQAVFDYAFEKRQFAQLQAHVDRLNYGSQRVCEKIGMNTREEFLWEDRIPAYRYRASNPSLTIKEITGKETYPVRFPVLRKGQPYSSCAMPADNEKMTIHYGLFYDEALIGVSTFMIESSELYSGVGYRLRGMAVLEEYQKKNMGRFLLEHGEQQLKAKGIDYLWFNARIAAVSFYEKMGYEKLSDVFEIEPIGPHFVMGKVL